MQSTLSMKIYDVVTQKMLLADEKKEITIECGNINDNGNTIRLIGLKFKKFYMIMLF